MKKFRTVAAVVIMFFAAMAGYFVGAALQEEMGGAILFAVIICASAFSMQAFTRSSENFPDPRMKREVNS